MPTLPADHLELVSDLSGIVSDHPYADPESTLAVLADDAAEAHGREATPEGRRERTGYTILLHATCWYVSARIFSKSLFASYVRALDGFRAQLDRASCACPAGAHPADLDSEYAVEAGVSMLTEAGRAVFADDYGLDEEELAAFDCEGFLAELVDEALGRLHEAHEEVFGGIDVSHLDAQFVRGDGRVDVVAVQEAIRRSGEGNTGPVALWSARRWLTGQLRDEERIGVFLCLWMGIAQTYEGLPPSYARDLAAALATIDLDVSCEHPQHPWSTADSTVQSRYRAVVHLYAPDDHPDTPVPAEFSARELWECPVQYAQLAQKALADLEAWRTMRGGHDADWED
ncbi:hypothetical protein HYE82_05440 [Streptomyces sp. BR123]|jgi:hypothetical protein|uniref:hypothetical protein n=1 Tax=Streptomyces sp. BR123 TaxID=2749828 RepID=UPI0015C4CCA9|nr:hypothetical protein [Streptomyces sp. BR123]NXY93845.1 hypothetical protein [Streptomyces sp. BR123]